MWSDAWPWWIVALGVVVDIMIRVIAIIVVPRNRRPTAATAWLLAIYFIPYIGVCLFLLIGNPRLPRARRKKQDLINATIAEVTKDLHLGGDHPDLPEGFASLVRMNQQSRRAAAVRAATART